MKPLPLSPRPHASAAGEGAGANINTIKAKPELAMTPQELSEYYEKLRALPPSTKPLLIENDTGEPLPSAAAE